MSIEIKGWLWVSDSGNLVQIDHSRLPDKDGKHVPLVSLADVVESQREFRKTVAEVAAELESGDYDRRDCYLRLLLALGADHLEALLKEAGK